jgi:hypothetical protein
MEIVLETKTRNLLAVAAHCCSGFAFGTLRCGNPAHKRRGVLALATSVTKGLVAIFGR